MRNEDGDGARAVTHSEQEHLGLTIPLERFLRPVTRVWRRIPFSSILYWRSNIVRCRRGCGRDCYRQSAI